MTDGATGAAEALGHVLLRHVLLFADSTQDMPNPQRLRVYCPRCHRPYLTLPILLETY